MSTPNILQHAELDGSSFTLSAGRTGILLLHGFTATTVEVRPMANFLHDFGYSVSGPLLPGHGHTPEELNKVSWKDWLKCADDSFLSLQSNCEKVFVLGESMGGLLALMLSINHPEIAGTMLFSPALIVPGLAAAEWLWPLKSYIWKKHIDETMEWKGFNVVPLHAAAQLLQLQRQVKNKLQLVTRPTLIFQGKLDHSIDQTSSVKILEGISSEEKRLIWLEESSHCVLIDRQLPDAEISCLEFIHSHE
ncbi:MAG: alpha/beta hydrolase [Anaerolineaceae bacterium]